jgi:hypothetical protein
VTRTTPRVWFAQRRRDRLVREFMGAQMMLTLDDRLHRTMMRLITGSDEEFEKLMRVDAHPKWDQKQIWLERRQRVAEYRARQRREVDDE